MLKKSKLKVKKYEVENCIVCINNFTGHVKVNFFTIDDTGQTILNCDKLVPTSVKNPYLEKVPFKDVTGVIQKGTIIESYVFREVEGVTINDLVENYEA